MIQKYEEGSDAKNKSAAGRPTQKLPPKQARQLVPESTTLVELAFPCKNWPLNMEFLPGMLKNPGQEWCDVQETSTLPQIFTWAG